MVSLEFGGCSVHFIYCCFGCGVLSCFVGYGCALMVAVIAVCL